MTKINIYMKNGSFTGFELDGHTEKEILCAAISTATQMTVLGIKDELKLNPFVKVSDGYLKLIINEKDVENEKVQLLMKTCYDTLRQIIKNQRKYVKLEVKENV